MPTVLMLLVALALVPAQQELPQPPEEYGGLNAWVEGEIIALSESAGLLLILPLEFTERSRAAGARSGGSIEPGRDAARAGDTILIELRYAKGWMYFDDPEGGPQRRFGLRDGRSRLEVGQLIEIGRSTEFTGGFERISGQVGNAFGSLGAGSGMKFKGWVMVRVNEFRSQ